MPTGKTYTTRPIAAFGKVVVLWLFINIGADVLNIGLAALDFALLSGTDASAPLDEFGSAPDPTGLLMITSLLRLPVLAVAVVTAILVLRWIYRANRNAHALARGLNSNPPWAVAWFFIPIAFLWKPFEPMEESWKVSQGAEGWRRRPTPSLLRWWFGLWLVATILGNAGLRFGFNAGSVGQLQFFAVIEILIAAASVGSALCLVRIVRGISQGLQRQIDSHAFA